MKEAPPQDLRIPVNIGEKPLRPESGSIKGLLRAFPPPRTRNSCVNPESPVKPRL